MNTEAGIENELETFFNLSSELLCIADMKGCFTRVNAAWSRMIKMPAEGCIGRPCTDFVHPDDIERTRAEVSMLAHGIATVSFQNRLIDADGGAHWLEWNARPSMDRGTIYCVVRDVTDRKETEDRLAIFADKVEASNRDLQAYALVASHDLQEPLRKIQSFGDLLKTECSSSLSDEGRTYVDSMCSAAARMQNLIADVLTLSRIATSEGEALPVDLNAVLDRVIDDLSPLAGERLDIRRAHLPIVVGDPVQMHQLFQNLLGNALKFCREGVAPHVVVSVGDDAVVGGRRMCTVDVSDNGIGFDPAHALTILTPFKRLNGRGRYAGNGIGLAICQRIVERHGATIRAIGRPDGATFSVTLPLAGESKGA